VTPERPRPDLVLAPEAARRMREQIARAGGREVSFLATVTPERVIVDPRTVARGNRAAVLAAAGDARAGEIMLHNHPSGLLEPSDADLHVAGRLYEQGLGSAIVDNPARALYVVVEPPPPSSLEPLDIPEMEALAAPGGALSRLHERYEDRPGQRAMLAEVARGYNQDGVTLVEAGTGTGKSVAYLLPAARWAIRNRERTIVSTNTINLQEQLVAKDLPLVRELLGEDFRWALMKGRGNYISIRRAHLAAESAATLFGEDRTREVNALLDWIAATEDGSLADLATAPSREVWEEVQSDSDICLHARCPHFQSCFYQRSRRVAASADVLVVNHHLLFSDLSLRIVTDNFTQSAALPAYRRLILDEAHNVEDAATSHLGASVSRKGLAATLTRLERVAGVVRRKLAGLPTVAEDGARSEGPLAGPAAKPLLDRLTDRVLPSLKETRARFEAFFHILDEMAPLPGGVRVRLGSEQLPEPIDQERVHRNLDALLDALAGLTRELSELGARIELTDEWREPLEGRVLDLRSIERRLNNASRSLRLVLDPAEEGQRYVRWVEQRNLRRGKHRNLHLAAAPIELAELLREQLFKRVRTTVLTSATLTTRKDFGFLRGRLGLARDPADAPALKVAEARIESPFDFAAQTLLCVPSDLPRPSFGGSAGSASFNRATARAVAALADISRGGLFALFTSHRALRAVAEALRAGGEGRWPLLVHGEDDRSRLLSRFVEAGNAILLGTSSFWEGVDVPGRPLRALLIQKLPFSVPTDPVVEARMEAIEAAGGNPFQELMLPQAALRLRQGFGRLVRSRRDRGAVVLLDSRIVKYRYGRYLLESLPPAPLARGPWRRIEEQLRAFYASSGEPGIARRMG